MGVWQIIVVNKDLDQRIGEHQEPKLIDFKIIKCKDKSDTKTRAEKMINKYIKKSYDWKSHGDGAFKFYYEQKGMDILTYVLIYFNGEEITGTEYAEGFWE